jgi:hypothetical protein
MIQTAGRFDPTDQPLYFIASTPETLVRASVSNRTILLAVNELGGHRDSARSRPCSKPT